VHIRYVHRCVSSLIPLLYLSSSVILWLRAVIASGWHLPLQRLTLMTVERTDEEQVELTSAEWTTALQHFPALTNLELLGCGEKLAGPMLEHLHHLSHTLRSLRVQDMHPLQRFELFAHPFTVVPLLDQAMAANPNLELAIHIECRARSVDEIRTHPPFKQLLEKYAGRMDALVAEGDFDDEDSMYSSDYSGYGSDYYSDDDDFFWDDFMH
jgi:hypothetical protein